MFKANEPIVAKWEAEFDGETFSANGELEIPSHLATTAILSIMSHHRATVLAFLEGIPKVGAYQEEEDAKGHQVS